MGCLAGCLRLLFVALWRALLAAVLGILFARVDAYVERRLGTHPAGRFYLRRRGRVRRGTPPDAASAIDTQGR